VYTNTVSPESWRSNQHLGCYWLQLKSPLIFLNGSGKSGLFNQLDYLSQVLEPAIRVIFEDFEHESQEHGGAPPIFMEDGNSAHGEKKQLPIHALDFEITMALLHWIGLQSRQIWILSRKSGESWNNGYGGDSIILHHWMSYGLQFRRNGMQFHSVMSMQR
jgi:hypothetical protein